ncbi:hypothetical protein AB870_13705 [Pandoraea faecigallinarum]|uniref:Uncharacterized protein n=1 Tax=Pandoraea faecigallinarum TaxID=656179 RepID=A0A0H3WTI4_9BURK|nr:hypothetical protein [Pandoraea faecigallinarum]AKM30940.1 hypothetical protein AB870_13705 [Pandoraea faecigallinarum]
MNGREAVTTKYWLRHESGEKEDDEAELINDPRLAGSFIDGAISTRRTPNDLIFADVRMEMLVARAEKTIAVAQSLREQYPDYANHPDFFMTFVYERMGLPVNGVNLDQMFSSPGAFLDNINFLWNEYRVGLGYYYQMASTKAILETFDNEATPHWSFMQVQEGASEQDMIEAVRSRQYILMHQAIGVMAPGLKMKLHTSGGDYYINHPEFGHIPGGLTYVDLRSWNGETRDFTKADVRKVDAM